MIEISAAEIKNNIGKDILLKQKNGNKEVKLRLVTKSNGVIKATSHNGKYPIYYEIKEGINSIPNSKIYLL